MAVVAPLPKATENEGCAWHRGTPDLAEGVTTQTLNFYRRSDCLMIYAMALGRTGVNKQICDRGKREVKETTDQIPYKDAHPGPFRGLFAIERLWRVSSLQRGGEGALLSV